MAPFRHVHGAASGRFRSFFHQYNRNGKRNDIIKQAGRKTRPDRNRRHRSVGRLLGSLKDYKKEALTAPALKMLEAFLDLFVPIVTAAVINVGIANGDKAYIFRGTGILVLLGLMGLAASITAQYFAAKAAVGVSADLRRKLFSHIAHLGYGELDTIGTGALITRMTSDIQQVQNGLNLFLRLFLRSPFIVFGSLVMAFTINVRAALIFAVLIPVLSLIVFGIMKITRPMYRLVQEDLDGLSVHTRENLTGVRVIRAFGRESKETEAFREKNAGYVRRQLAVGRLSAFMNPLTFAVVNIALIALLRTGAVQIRIGNMAQGDVVALVNYLSQILIELVKLADLIVQFTRAMACSDRVHAVLSVEPSMTYGTEEAGTAADGAPGVEFSHVSFTYPGGGSPALTDISFAAGPGETVGIIGGTGSGKSTVVQLIGRFYDADEGTVRLFGKDARTYSKEALRKMTALVPQKAQLFSGTIRSNLLWGNKNASEEELLDALEAAQAAEFVSQKEGKLDAVVEQGGRNFSGGQKQRLTIARALVKKAEILILDDSASALDYATDAALREAIRERSGSGICFIVSQRANAVMNADRILVLEDGAQAGLGTHEELMEACPVYREIFDSQFGEEAS